MLRKLSLLLSLVLLILNISLVSAWWNESYEERYTINNNNSGYTGLGYFGANRTGAYGTLNNSGGNEQMYLYHDISTGNMAIATNTTEFCWFDTENDVSNCPIKTGSASSLVLYWALCRGSGDVKDYIGNNDGTNDGATRSVSGQVGDAFDFVSGNSEKIDSTFNLQSEGIDDKGTISLWINPDNSLGSTAEGILSVVYNSQNEIRLMNFNNGNFYYRVNDGTNHDVVTTDSWPSTWVHIVITWDTSISHSELFFNANSKGTSSPGPPNLNADITFGYDPSGAGYWNGKIDDVRIYDDILTSTEISNLYSSTKDKFPYLEVKETIAPVDTCSCPGAGNDWEIDMSDYCNITSDCDLTTGKLSFIGSGKTRINAIIHTTDLGDPGTNGILKILLNCWIWDY